MIRHNTKPPDMWEFAAAEFSKPPYSNGNDAKYEQVKKKIREKWGKDAVNASNKQRLKVLARPPDMWAFVAEEFSSPPYSDGKDAKYAQVKKRIRDHWGKSAINDLNKPRLKNLALLHAAKARAAVAARRATVAQAAAP